MKEITFPDPIVLTDLEGKPLPDEHGQPGEPLAGPKLAIGILSQQGEKFADGLDCFEGPERLAAVAKTFRDALRSGARKVHLENDDHRRLLAAAKAYKQHPVIAACALPHLQAIRDARDFVAPTADPYKLDGLKAAEERAS